MIHFSVNTAPMGAVRMTQRGKWNSQPAQRYMSYKHSIAWSARQVIKQPIDKPIRVKMEFYFPIPESMPKYKQKEALAGQRLPVVKPDLDNCVKGVFDGLNKIAWLDDNQVVEETSIKRYSDNPRIEITIEEVGA